MAVQDPSRPADAKLIDDQQVQRLDREIGRLPAPLKEALLLTAFEGRSQQEAGQILGVSAKTIETRAYRARKRLAERLQPDMRPE